MQLCAGSDRKNVQASWEGNEKDKRESVPLETLEPQILLVVHGEHGLPWVSTTFSFSQSFINILFLTKDIQKQAEGLLYHPRRLGLSP